PFMLVLFRHDGACPRRAMTDRLDQRTPKLPRFRVASAARGGGCDAETKNEDIVGARSSLSVIACMFILTSKDTPLPSGMADWWHVGVAGISQFSAELRALGGD